MSVADELVGLGLFLGPNGIGSVFVNGLRSQAQMPHDRNAGAENALYRLEDLLASFELDGIGLGLLHDTDGRRERFARVALIRAERHINDHQSPLDGPRHAARMIDHMVERHRNGRLETGHHVGGRIPDQHDVHPGGIDDTGHRVVVGRQHRNLFPATFHLPQAIGRHHPRFAVCRHGFFVFIPDKFRIIIGNEQSFADFFARRQPPAVGLPQRTMPAATETLSECLVPP